MNIDDVELLYEYNWWANRRICEVCRRLDTNEFTRDLGAGHASVRGTLVHIMWGEWLWLQRWQGLSPKTVFAAETFATQAEIDARWQEIEGQQRAFLGRLTEAALAERVSYENQQGERWEYTRGEMMVHVVNHSSFHRGQVTAFFRQLGKPPLPTDFLMHIDERR